jgi:hypothetical protein
VVGVVHPAPLPGGLAPKLRKARRQLRDSGPVYGTLRVLASVPSPVIGWDWISATEEAEERFFPDVDEAYRDLVAPIAHTVSDVNAPAAIRLVRDLRPDAVVCLGGPIYRRPLIEACEPMFNFHSGISPIYNGASTIMFAFANGHFRLCGGTLMTMSPVVDGGDILAHFLPAIDEDDTPATLFMKTVRGAAQVYDEFLTHLEQRGAFTKAPQPPPLFTCTSEGWTLYQAHRIRRHLERGAVSAHVRREEAIAYWDLQSDAEARDRAQQTIRKLLGLEWDA